MSLSIEIRRSLEGVAAQGWDALVGDGCPFFEHAFLNALEAAGCVGGDTGWDPRYVLCRQGADLVGALPLFRKDHGYGEFIFDWAWADAAHRAGMPYYPKLVVAAPFSPVGGRRFLLAPGADDAVRDALLRGARQAAAQEAATGIHWLYVSEDEAAFLETRGLAIRHTHQFHWHNADYQTFDDFLGRFRSKRRNQIRRERRAVRDAGVQIEIRQGDALGPEDLDDVWMFYQTTVDKFVWGRRYLNRRFFARLLDTFRDRLMLVRAVRDGQVVAGAINVIKPPVLYGRYWGCREEIPFLHFEVCSYAGIDAAIAQGVQRFEAGAGGGSHKFGRGFLPQRTWSAHEIYIPALDRAVRAFLEQERQGLDAELAAVGDAVFKTPLESND